MILRCLLAFFLLLIVRISYASDNYPVEYLGIERGLSNNVVTCIYQDHATPVIPAEITLDYILDERVRELVGEENRRMTLMRTKTLVERAKRLNAVSPVNQLTGIEDKHLLMPIPQSEINLNKDAVLEQNPNY